MNEKISLDGSRYGVNTIRKWDLTNYTQDEKTVDLFYSALENEKHIKLVFDSEEEAKSFCYILGPQLFLDSDSSTSASNSYHSADSENCDNDNPRCQFKIEV